MRVLVVNAGSSSVKLRLLDDRDTELRSTDLSASAGEFDTAELRAALQDFEAVDAVGHRVVHGGPTFTGPVLINDRVLDDIAALRNLAPLHQDAALAGIRAVAEVVPDVPAVACFDTALHADLPPAASTYAIPAEWRERFRARRYGFHGLSHAYAARRATEMTGHTKVVSCHLGSGASLAAMSDGRSMDTTMGFTPLEGIVMATRSGSVDPGLVLWLQQHGGLSTEEVSDGLEHQSGLLGLAGTSDMRTVAVDKGLAFDVYIHRLRAAVAAMAAALAGFDVLSFTGGIGENSAPVRAAACAGLGFLGVSIDDTGNATAEPDHEISADDSSVRIVVVRAREDIEINHQVREVLRTRELQ